MDERYERVSDTAERLARGLGWVSIGLGMAELIYGRRLGEVIGLGYHPRVMRTYGLREIGAGLVILAADDPRLGVWARVAGDLLDLATLMPALSADTPDRDAARTTLGVVAAVTALDLACAQALQARERLAPPPPDYSDRAGIRLHQQPRIPGGPPWTSHRSSCDAERPRTAASARWSTTTSRATTGSPTTR